MKLSSCVGVEASVAFHTKHDFNLVYDNSGWNVCFDFDIHQMSESSKHNLCLKNNFPHNGASH